jgi:hypothetical protein
MSSLFLVYCCETTWIEFPLLYNTINTMLILKSDLFGLMCCLINSYLCSQRDFFDNLLLSLIHISLTINQDENKTSAVTLQHQKTKVYYEKS